MRTHAEIIAEMRTVVRRLFDLVQEVTGENQGHAASLAEAEELSALHRRLIAELTELDGQAWIAQPAV